MGHDVRHATGADGHPADLEKFVGRFFWSDPVDGEAALHIIKETEVLARLFNGYYIYTELDQKILSFTEIQGCNTPMNPAG